MIFIKQLNKYFVVILLFLGAQAFTNQPDSEQAKNKHHSYTNIVYSDIGINHSMMTLGLGYGHYFDIESINRRLFLFADYAVPLASIDFLNFRAQSGLRTSIIEIGSFQLPLWLSFNITGANNKIFKAVGLGSELGISPGYYGRRFVVASEVSLDQTWAAYLKHSGSYREQFYEDVKDGWYSLTSTFFRAGLHLAWHIHPRFTLGLKGGYQQMGQYNKLVPPIYYTLNTGINF